MAMPNHLVLIRHGESEANFAREQAKRGATEYITEEFRNLAESDYRLTAKGAEQAQQTGVWLQHNILKPNGLSGFDRYICSPHVRTQETAANLKLPGAKWRPYYGMVKERSWGEIAALTREDHRRKYPENYAWKERDPLLWSPPGGESIAQVAETRVNGLLSTLHRNHQEKEVTSVLIVTHGDFMNAVRLRLEYMTSHDWLAHQNDPIRKINNCQIDHYTRLDPETNKQAPYLRWVRSVAPWQDTTAATKWRVIKRPLLSNDQLLEAVEKTPRLYKNENNE